MAIAMSLHSLIWNKYSPLPEGMPRVLAEQIVPSGEKAPVIDALWFPGCGYCYHWQSLNITPLRRLSEETKQKIRRKALTRRAEANVPLFAADFIATRLAQKPDYFGFAR